MREQAYRFYVADALWAISENTAKQVGGKSIKARFSDLISSRSSSADDKTGEEIALDVIRQAGLEVVPRESV